MSQEYLEAHIKEYLDEEDFERCLQACQELIELDPNNKAVHNYVAFCLFRLERYQQALELYDKIIAEGQTGFSQHVFRGDCYYEIGEYIKAIRDYVASLKIRPTAASSWDRLARCFFILHDFEAAYEYIDRAIELSGKGLWSWTMKALFLRKQGRTIEAFNLLGEIRKAYPDSDYIRKKQFEILSESFGQALAPDSKRKKLSPRKIT